MLHMTWTLPDPEPAQPMCRFRDGLAEVYVTSGTVVDEPRCLDHAFTVI